MVLDNRLIDIRSFWRPYIQIAKLLFVSALLPIQSDISIYIVHLEAYANHLSGVQVMATIGLQCNSLSQVFTLW